MLNISKARRELEVFENRSLDLGLREVIAWFEETKSYL